MAKEVALFITADDDTATHVTTRPVTSSERDAIIAWLIDRSRPGVFSYSPYWISRPTSVVFRITDPDVAMEFKMRFG